MVVDVFVFLGGCVVVDVFFFVFSSVSSRRVSSDSDDGMLFLSPRVREAGRRVRQVVSFGRLGRLELMRR